MAGILLVVSCMTTSPKGGADSTRNPASVDFQSLSPDDAFKVIHQVATGPRCTNCHAKGERPLQLEGADSRFHNMYVHRQFSQLGGLCVTCHQNRNFDTAHMPPGAENWRMPSSMKSYDGQTTADELCHIWKSDRNQFEEGAQTGQKRTPQELLDHVSNDPLVKWAFDPGPGRTPAGNSLGTTANGHAIFVQYYKAWVDGGAPCPDDKN